MTARQIIEARLGRDLGPLATMPRDLRRALYRLALQLQRMKDMTDDHPDTDLTDPHGEAEALRRENERLRRNDAILHDTIEKLLSEGAQQLARAEAAEAALARMGVQVIADDDMRRKIDEGRRPMDERTIAQAAEAYRRLYPEQFAAIRAPDPVANAGSCQPGDLISREAALSAVKRECNAWDRNGTRAAQQIARCLAVVIRAIPAAPVAEAPTIGGAELDALVRRLQRADEYDPLGHDGWQAAAAITALRAKAKVEPWQDMSTAPMDGTEFDAWCENPAGGRGYRFCNVKMRGDGSGIGYVIHLPDGVAWQYLDARDRKSIFPKWVPTHWMPAPAGPRIRAALEGGE